MHPLELIAGQAEWVGANMAHNVDFIPADKLDWKPEPTASSALEIVHHAASEFVHFLAFLSEAEQPDPAVPTDHESAKALLHESSAQYAAWLRTVDPSTLEESLTHPYVGAMSRAQMTTVPVIDVIHHHGQIAYIQTLLGDTESHFAPMD